jgi:hypothetical protein
MYPALSCKLTLYYCVCILFLLVYVTFNLLFIFFFFCFGLCCFNNLLPSYPCLACRRPAQRRRCRGVIPPDTAPLQRQSSPRWSATGSQSWELGHEGRWHWRRRPNWRSEHHPRGKRLLLWHRRRHEPMKIDKHTWCSPTWHAKCCGFVEMSSF